MEEEKKEPKIIVIGTGMSEKKIIEIMKQMEAINQPAIFVDELPGIEKPNINDLPKLKRPEILKIKDLKMYNEKGSKYHK